MDKILDDANVCLWACPSHVQVLAEAGVAAIVIEVVPRALGQQISESVSVPTIGIGNFLSKILSQK